MHGVGVFDFLKPALANVIKNIAPKIIESGASQLGKLASHHLTEKLEGRGANDLSFGTFQQLRNAGYGGPIHGYSGEMDGSGTRADWEGFRHNHKGQFHSMEQAGEAYHAAGYGLGEEEAGGYEVASPMHGGDVAQWLEFSEKTKGQFHNDKGYVRVLPKSGKSAATKRAEAYKKAIKEGTFFTEEGEHITGSKALQSNPNLVPWILFLRINANMPEGQKLSKSEASAEYRALKESGQLAEYLKSHAKRGLTRGPDSTSTTALKKDLKGINFELFGTEEAKEAAKERKSEAAKARRAAAKAAKAAAEDGSGFYLP
jgi:hypothetical protein